MTCIVLKPHNVGNSELMILHFIDFLKRRYSRDVTRISRTQSIVFATFATSKYPVFLFGHIVTCSVWETKTCKDLDQFWRENMKLKYCNCQCWFYLAISLPFGCGDYDQKSFYPKANYNVEMWPYRSTLFAIMIQFMMVRWWLLFAVLRLLCMHGSNNLLSRKIICFP